MRKKRGEFLMNQILYTNDKSGVSSSEMKSIVRFFVVAIIVFALILVGEGVLGLFNRTDEVVVFACPNLTKEKNGSYVTLNFDGDTRVNKVIYVWDDGMENTYQANAKTNFSFEVEIPPGEHMLKTTVVDVNGNKTRYEDIEAAFTENDDATKPQITIERKTAKLEIVATDDTELDYFSYQWEGEEEVVVQPSEEDKTTARASIEVEEGSKKITLKAVDKTGNKNLITRKVVASNGPTISASIADNSFVVNITDDVEITKIVYTHNEEEKTIDDIPKGTKEYEFKVPLKDGDNYLKIDAYEGGVMTEYKCKKTR